LNVIIFLEYIEDSLTDVSFHHEDRGETRTAEMPALGRHGDAQIEVDQGVVVGGLLEVERNLQGLVMGIPPLRRREVPLHLQRHTVGVSESLNSLLRKITRAVICYSQHNVMQGD
jgi:hypothetical protein